MITWWLSVTLFLQFNPDDSVVFCKPNDSYKRQHRQHVVITWNYKNLCFCYLSMILLSTKGVVPLPWQKSPPHCIAMFLPSHIWHFPFHMWNWIFSQYHPLQLAGMCRAAPNSSKLPKSVHNVDVWNQHLMIMKMWFSFIFVWGGRGLFLLGTAGVTEKIGKSQNL